MKVQHIIGADLSKKSIDLVYQLSKTYIKIDNSTGGFNDLMGWLQKLNIDISETMIVMEHTGLYSYCFESFLHQLKLLFVRSLLLKLKDQSVWSVARQISWMLPGSLSMAMKRKTGS
jgi:hypothetical protein